MIREILSNIWSFVYRVGLGVLGLNSLFVGVVVWMNAAEGPVGEDLEAVIAIVAGGIGMGIILILLALFGFKRSLKTLGL